MVKNRHDNRHDELLRYVKQHRLTSTTTLIKTAKAHLKLAKRTVTG
ncbi:hypothetical protein VIA_000308 [Vibrio orientalis CIP 102891 = ATCC 33934]|uniref:Transposase n=1 Tax=Vibrio orientalis CIP 102891 = ATCC 33934 TaxID=675816 RepID=A0ABP2H568_VIBOR|nr:hypothetical protein VIA_000308 [Vibrio orientalis CIP 102891 = ATCC 33934]